MAGLSIFRDVVRELTLLAETDPDEPTILAAARPLMSELLARDTWLPDAFAEPGADSYRQYLLHCDPRERLSLVSFVWGPGQETPIHDHTVWGLLGVLRGSEVAQRYVLGDAALHPTGPLEHLDSGATDLVSPTIGDIHRVRNGSASSPSVSIHLYGGNIGRISRHAYTPQGATKTFTSGYSSSTMPNIWS